MKYEIDFGRTSHLSVTYLPSHKHIAHAELTL